MLKTFKYRLYPNNKQCVLINKHIGSVRFVYNIALETKQTAWAGNRVNLSCFDLIKQLPDLKEHLPWLKEINSQTLQQPIRNLDNAFTRFFKGQSDFPKFKKKLNKGSFCIPQNVSLKNGKLTIPKFKEGIRIKLHRPTKGLIKQASISKTTTGKYFVSILCDTGDDCIKKPMVDPDKVVGIDLGIKTFIVSSDGNKYDNPKYLRKASSKLSYTHSKYSKYKGKRTRKKLAILNEKITNKRKDFLHKISSELIKNHDSIATENLRISNMIKNHKLAKSIQDCSWSMFLDLLEYKSEWNGVNILKIGTFDPSSKTCSCCGNINKELLLKHREWTCGNCGSVLDRDVNAAINIKNFAIKKYLSTGCRLKNQGKLPTLVGAVTLEA